MQSITVYKISWIQQILSLVIVQKLWFVLKTDKEPFDEEAFRQELNPMGDSLLVISDDEIAKVHIHSETPGAVLSSRSKIW